MIIKTAKIAKKGVALEKNPVTPDKTLETIILIELYAEESADKTVWEVPITITTTNTIIAKPIIVVTKLAGLNNPKDSSSCSSSTFNFLVESLFLTFS